MMDGGSPRPETAPHPRPPGCEPWLLDQSLPIFCLLDGFVHRLREIILCFLGLLPPAAESKARVQVQMLYLGSDLRRHPLGFGE